MKIFILLLMMFMHVTDDFYLQGILANMKQKDWWTKQSDRKLYKYDYIWALLVHSFSWAFMISLPIMLNMRLHLTMEFVVIFIVQLLIHAIIDDLKANEKMINLWIDQLIHIAQIVAMFAYFVV